jgi:hypothetical protein
MHAKTKQYFTDERPIQKQSQGSTRMRIIPVYDSRTSGKRPVGIARVVSYIPKRHELATVFRLTIPGRKLSMLWVCDRGVFVPLPGDD